MNIRETAKFLAEVYLGHLPLKSIVGRKYECSFDGYELAGVISTVRKQDRVILLDFPVDGATLTYRFGADVEVAYSFYSTDVPHQIRDFVLD